MSQPSSSPKKPNSSSKKPSSSSVVLVLNKRARYDYQIDHTLTAGVVLTGAETKSLRLKQGSLNGSYVQILADQTAVLLNSTITLYKFASTATSTDYDPQRTRPLLLKKKEIYQLAEKASQKGWSLIPLAFELHGRKVKLLIGVGRGKKTFEKRATIKERDLKRDLRRQGLSF